MQESEENVNPLRRQEFFFWLCAYAAVLVFLGRNSLFGPEALVAEAAREIVVSQDWSVRINFAPFSGLHPLNVCGVALLYLVVGVSEFFTRIIAAVTTLILLSGVRRLAVLLFDRRTALVAGWLTLGSYSVLYLGRSAGDCIPACAAAVWAIAWYLGAPPRMSFRRALIFYLLLFFSAVLYDKLWLLAPGFLLPWWIAERSLRGALSRKGVTALAIVCVFGVAWWLRCGGLDMLALWWRDPAVAAGGLFASIGEGYLSRGWRSLYMSPLNIVRVLLPWPLLALTAAIAEVRRHQTAPAQEKLLCRGILTMFAVSLVLPAYQWRLMMPLLPFMLLVTAHVSADEAEKDRWTAYALSGTRSVLLIIASLGVVSPVALPALKALLKLDLPLVVILTSVVTGIAVLAIMTWDSYPGVPLCNVSGLSPRLNSIILGGTLITIGVVSLIVPAFRDMRGERPFMLEVREKTADLPSEAVVLIGDAKHAAALLFYNRMKSPVTLVGSGDYAKFLQLIERRRGRGLAVVSRCREGSGHELEFLRSCAERGGLRLDISKPNVMENLPPFGSRDRQNALFLMQVPESGTGRSESETSTVKGK